MFFILLFTILLFLTARDIAPGGVSAPGSSSKKPLMDKLSCNMGMCCAGGISE